jgi:putative molybdenum carrier protein
VGTLTKIISGGQTGVDQAALRAGKDCGLEIGGWCPPGRVCESGVIPAEFPLQETEQERSPDAPDIARSQRTEWNVRDSDATLVIRSGEASHSDAATEEVADPGTEWAMQSARRYGRPLLVCNVDDSKAKEKIQRWLVTFAIDALNVAGPSEASSRGIGDRAYALLLQVFSGGAKGR